MSEPDPSNTIAEVPLSTIEVQDRDAIIRLARLLRPGQASLIVDKLEEVMQSTGYGDIKLIVAEGRIVRIKVEKSY